MGPNPTIVLVAGDDEEAKAALISAIGAGGVDALDVGGLSRARELEAMGFLQIKLAASEKVGWTGGFARRTLTIALRRRAAGDARSVIVFGASVIMTEPPGLAHNLICGLRVPRSRRIVVTSKVSGHLIGLAPTLPADQMN